MSADSVSAEWDWHALRAAAEAGQTPEWIAQHGEHEWEAGLVVSGQLSQARLDGLSKVEREHYALASKDKKDGKDG